MNGRRVPGAAAASAAALDLGVEPAGAGVVAHVADVGAVDVTAGAPERRRAHEGRDVGFGDPGERCLHAVRLEDDDDEVTHTGGPRPIPVEALASCGIRRTDPSAAGY